MLCRGKYRHIHANLEDERHSRQRGEGKIGNRMGQLQLVRIRFSKPEDFGFDTLPVFIELANVEQAFLEFGCLLTEYRSVHGRLNFLRRVFVASVDK